MKQIDFFKSNKKYLENLFIELNDAKEVLRYFIYGLKWKFRITKDFNLVFQNEAGRFLQQSVRDKKTKFFISIVETFFCPIGQLTLDIIKAFHIFEKQDFDEHMCIKKDDNSYERFIKTGYYYNKIFENLHNKLVAMQSNCILLKGSAGNGKTNLLCNIAELIINLNNPCLLINARDINKDVKTYIFQKIPCAEILKLKCGMYMLFYIKNLILYIQRKRFFIIIDAINENDEKDFQNTFNDFIDFIREFKNIKLIMSCRSEYFEERYRNLFKEKQDDFIFVYDIQQSYYSKRIKNKLFLNYKNEFKFNGKISENTFLCLIKSLLLMRIFFEVYENSCEEISNLNKFKIYKKYIERLKNSVNNSSLLIDKLVSKMIEKNKFDEISINELELSDDEIKKFKKIADENLLISRAIKKYENTPLETDVEVFYFVFDELRDYCISTYVITSCINNNDNVRFSSLYILINNLNKLKNSALEGILTYSYNYFRVTSNTEHCKKILSNLTDVNVGLKRRRLQINEEIVNNFDNLGLNIIFGTNKSLLDYELEFIKNCIISNGFYTLMSLVGFLYRCDLDNNPYYSIVILNRILLSVDDFETLQKLLGRLFEEEQDGTSLLDRLRKLSGSKKDSWLEFVGIVVLTIGVDHALIAKEIPTHTNVIKNIANKSCCKELKDKADLICEEII